MKLASPKVRKGLVIIQKRTHASERKHVDAIISDWPLLSDPVRHLDSHVTSQTRRELPIILYLASLSAISC